jgi:UPF0042 nucleotide-binding protein
MTDIEQRLEGAAAPSIDSPEIADALMIDALEVDPEIPGGPRERRGIPAGRAARLDGDSVADPEAPIGSRDEMDLVVVTGLSGAGRSTVARALENVGYYVVDNLPQTLMMTMAELAYASGGAGRRTAMTLDVRSRAFSTDLISAVADLRERGFRPRVVFVDATDDVRISRFESVRRPHPLQGDGRLADGIANERMLLANAREASDVVIDTSLRNGNQLRRRIEELFVTQQRTLHVTTLSFGFKYGLPADADLVIDMRFLPNPHWVPELRPKTGQDPAVSAYVLSQPGAEAFVDAYADLVASMTDGYKREGKRYLTIAVGCTGGKHRSVATAEALATRLEKRGFPTVASHRDLGRE